MTSKAHQRSEASFRDAPARGNQPAVLIVEDDADIRNLLAEILAGEGYQVRIATNGRDGLEQLTLAPTPALVMLDLMMPVMNGFEFRRRQVSDPRLAEIPVVLMSADNNLHNWAIELRADCMKKPIGLGELLKKVERYCR